MKENMRNTTYALHMNEIRNKERLKKGQREKNIYDRTKKSVIWPTLVEKMSMKDANGEVFL